MKLLTAVKKGNAIQKASLVEGEWGHAASDSKRGLAVFEKAAGVVEEHEQTFGLGDLSSLIAKSGSEAATHKILEHVQRELEQALQDCHAIISPLVGMYVLRVKGKAVPIP